MNHPYRAAALAVAGLLGIGLVPIASAEAGTMSVNRNLDYSGENGAGEFGVTSFEDGPDLADMGPGVGVAGNVFQTFCLEANENISSGVEYEFEVDTGAVGGGYSGGNPDPLSSQTAYLFHQFLAGDLSNYDYTLGSDRRSSATALQLAIWHFEGELGTAALQNEFNGNAQAQAWVSEADDSVDVGGAWFGIGLGDVVVLNLRNAAGVNAQSMLAELRSGDIQNVIPLPPAVGLGLGLMACMSGATVVRRRRQSRI
jgi:hypothetical protein